MPNTAFDLFISYRRSDSAGHARALYRDLCRRFDQQRIFFDRESIEAGTVFPDRLREGVESCHVLVALIAPGWLEAKTAAGARRLDAEDDFVRREIATALHLRRKIIPVLFDDALPPEAAQLPEELRALASCDALMLRGKNYEYETQLEELVRLLAAVPGMTAPLPPSQGVIVGGGLEFDIYRGARYIPIRLRAPLRAIFKPIIDDRTRIFAGRRRVFERIMQFAAREEGGVLVITGPPGFGKTALIANLVSGTPEAFAYHFFSPLYGEETLDEKFFLQNVLQQMTAWHGYSAELPDAINELRALYQQLVDTPLEGSQVLVLDGLDEVTRWKLDPYLGRRPPAHLHIVATVRDVGQDWQTEYSLPADQVTTLPLGGLERDEIRVLFAGLGAAGLRIAQDEALLQHIVELAAYENNPDLGADPFYIRFLAEDVADSKVAPEEIPAQPKGLVSYLDRWWKQIAQLAGDMPVRDLFGTLAAAVGPISRADLEAVNPSLKDEWSGDFFDQVLGRVRRLVRQHRDGSYSLAHPRLRRYVDDPARIGKINDYRSRLLEYCAGWKVHRSAYGLSFYVAHLAAAGHIEDIYSLFSGEWIAAQWSVLGTYSQLVSDLDRAAKCLLDAPAPDYTRILALVAARQTARELMLGFPKELFVAWAGQGQIERTLACLGALSTAEGRAIDVLVAVAGKLLELHRTGTGDYASIAARLLEQAADQLPLDRTTLSQFEAFSDLSALLGAESGLPEVQRLKLARQLADFAGNSDDEVFRPAGAAAIASALSSSPTDADTARQFMARARAALPQIGRPADRAFVLMNLLSALHTFAPGDVLRELEDLVAQGPPLLEHGSIVKIPCVKLLKRWRPSEGEAPQRAAALLIRYAELYLGNPDAGHLGNGLAAIVAHLCRLGKTAAALELMERCAQMDPLECSRVVVNNIGVLREFAPDRLSGWMEAAVKFTAEPYHDMRINRILYTAGVAEALATIGRWDEALGLAATLSGGECANALVGLLRLAVTAFDGNSAARLALIDRLLGLATKIDAESDIAERAKVGAVGVQVLGSRNGSRADTELAHATALCLAQLPEGDADNLRRLHALALHQNGNYNEALAEVSRMTWVTVVAETLLSLIDAGFADPLRRDAYAVFLIEELSRREGASSFGEALKKIALLVVRLSRESAPVAGPLQEYVAGKLGLLGLDDSVTVYATISAAACYIDPDQGARQFEGLLNWIDAGRAENLELSAAAIAEVIGTLASAAGPLAGRFPHFAERLQLFRTWFREGEDALAVWGALCLIEAQSGCEAALRAMEGLLPRVEAEAAAQPGVAYLSRMIADMIGRRVGGNEPQANAAISLAKTVIRCARDCPAEAASVFNQVIHQALSIDDPDDRTQALIDIFAKLKDAPAAWPPDLGNLLSSTLDAAQLDDATLANALWDAAITAICATGDVAAAERLARRSTSAELQESLLVTVRSAGQGLALGELSAFEREFVRVGNRDLSQAVLHSVKLENDSANVLRYIAERLVSEEFGAERLRLLADFLPSTVAPLMTLSGIAEIGRLISEVEAFDQAFVDAAQIVGG